jgi:hypothetical protein
VKKFRPKNQRHSFALEPCEPRRLLAAPAVTALHVAATHWTPAFKQQLAQTGQGSPAYGYSIPIGQAQLTPLPWSNLNQISITFDQPVSLEPTDLTITGLATPSYATKDFTYDRDTLTATWTLAAHTFSRDTITLNLDANGLQPIVDSGGFESPAYTAGPLENQNAWIRTNSPGTALVQPAAGTDATQGVIVTRLAADQRWAVRKTIAAPTAPVVVAWDMYVQQTLLPEHSFGPFMGIEVYDDNGHPPRLAGAAGVDAATGELLYQQAGTGFIVAVPDLQIPFNTWHHFELSLDYATDTYSVRVDGVRSVTSEGFVDPGVDDFTDADVAALAAAADPISQSATGLAHFDNYSVSLQTPPIDGEWQNAADAFPSGDGTPGGDFKFTFNALPGDFTGDGRVNFRDLVTLAQNYNKPGNWSQGDATADGQIAFQDLVVLAQNYGASLPASAPTPVGWAPPTTSRDQLGSSTNARSLLNSPPRPFATARRIPS